MGEELIRKRLFNQLKDDMDIPFVLPLKEPVPEQVSLAYDDHDENKEIHTNEILYNNQSTEDSKVPVDSVVEISKNEEITDEEYRDRVRTMQYPPLPTNLLGVLKGHFEKVKEKEEYKQRARILRSKLDVFSNGDSTELCLGDERLRKVFWLLNNMGYTRSPDQVLFHHSYVMACLPLIYGSDWPRNSVRVMKSYRLQQLEQLVLVLTPRRIGKTVSVAMFVGSLLLCIPGLTIAVFSTCQRASTAIMKLVLKIMSGIPDTARRILANNKETLQIGETALPAGVGPNSAMAKKMANTPGVSVLNCFPASENSKCLYLFQAIQINLIISYILLRGLIMNINVLFIRLDKGKDRNKVT